MNVENSFLRVSDDGQSAAGFIGGRPRLPAGTSIPTCLLCGAEQAFFYQLRFPNGHPWEALSLAQFQCTSCADESWLIPEMLSELKGAAVSEEFLSAYQRNFRTLVFPTRDERPTSYEPSLVTRGLAYSRARQGAIAKLTEPEWLLEDESPRTIAGKPAVFLHQVFRGLTFTTVEGARPQIEIGLDGTPTPATPGAYELFIGNELYYFGSSPESRNVYVITQVD